MKTDTTAGWRQVLRESGLLARTTRITSTNEILRVAGDDGEPLPCVRAWWRDGVATVNICPRCGRSHSHAMPARGIVYLPMGCHRRDDQAPQGFYLVDARSAEQMAVQHPRARRNGGLRPPPGTFSGPRSA